MAFCHTLPWFHVEFWLNPQIKADMRGRCFESRSAVKWVVNIGTSFKMYERDSNATSGNYRDCFDATKHVKR